MSGFLKYSYLNPIRFYQIGKDDLFTNEIPFWEYKTNYFQKFRESDTLNFQILCTDPGLVIDLRVNNVLTGVEVYHDAIYWSHFSYGIPPYYMYQFKSTVLTPGYPIPYRMLLQIVLTIISPDGDIYFKSEYIYLYPDSYSDRLIDNTQIITVNHDENDYDYLFIDQDGNNTGDIMMRVEGGFPSDGFQPGGKYSLYQDLQYKPVILQAIPYNVQRFTIGSNFGVPNWLADKLSRAFACSVVKINGVQYCRNEGGKFEPIATDHWYPCKAWSIDLIKSANPYSGEYNYIAPATIPFLGSSATLGSTGKLGSDEFE